MDNNVQVNEDTYIQSAERAVFGCVNGILFYDFVYPYILLIFFQLVLGANYSLAVEQHAYLLQILLTLLTTIITLVAAIFIAKPKLLKKSFSKLNIDSVKLILSTFGIMFVFTLGYNTIISLLGVDIGGGNTNQVGIVEYIRNVPMLSFLAFVIFGPVLEEITYRYFLFGGIRKINPKLAIIVSGFVFMLVHGIAGFTTKNVDILKEIIILPPYMFSGCMLAYSYNKSNNLSVSVGVHVLNNLVSFILSCI